MFYLCVPFFASNAASRAVVLRVLCGKNYLIKQPIFNRSFPILTAARNLYYLILLFLSIIPLSEINAQDVHFSQFYATPLYLSPSLAGSSNGARVVLNYRNQWPGIKTTYTTQAVSFDNYFAKVNSGFGVQLIQDKAGSADLTFTHAALQYSYAININDIWQVIPAIQASYGSRAIDFDKLIFADENISGGGSGSWGFLKVDKTEYVDFAASVMMYSRRIWVGLTVDHLDQPNHSFLGETIKLYRKYLLFGGYNIWTERRRFSSHERSFSTSFRFQNQHNFNQFDVGAYWLNFPIEFGIWYRGIPVFTQVKNRINQDALVFSVNYQLSMFRFGYSYDFTISNLSLNGYGSHEISLIFELNQRNRMYKDGKRPALPCSGHDAPIDIVNYKFLKKPRKF